MCIRGWDAEYKIDTKGTEVEEGDCRALSRDRVRCRTNIKVIYTARPFKRSNGHTLHMSTSGLVRVEYAGISEATSTHDFITQDCHGQ